MSVREAMLSDMPAMQRIRGAVKENILSNPALVTEKDYEDYLFNRGKGWVYERDNQIKGFIIIDAIDKNVWALFVDPQYEGKGIGSQLHNVMLHWYFNQDNANLELSTEKNTKAEEFYKNKGWIEKGLKENGEIIFEYNYNTWKELVIKKAGT